NGRCLGGCRSEHGRRCGSRGTCGNLLAGILIESDIHHVAGSLTAHSRNLSWPRVSLPIYEVSGQSPPVDTRRMGKKMIISVPWIDKTRIDLVQTECEPVREVV